MLGKRYGIERMGTSVALPTVSQREGQTRVARRDRLAVALFAALLVAAPAAAASKPNVLLLIADDMNDWVGPLGGHPQTLTPNLESLARRGMLFTNAHTAAPACKPSRAAMWSGKRPATTGMYLNSQDENAFWSRYSNLFEHFAANGYRTYGSGKIFHEPARNEGVFDVASHAFATESAGATKRKYGNLNVGTNSASELHDVKVSRWALAELAKPEIRQQPFLMALGLYTTHLPWVVTPETWELSRYFAYPAACLLVLIILLLLA